MLYNLLSNAFKFTLSGGIISVRIRQAIIKGMHEHECKAIQIIVEDTGIGIEASKQEKISTGFTK
ncbi:MAG: hypothetical protein HC906_03170 [Bacteroidales bacterium]|nr:hypothetical protein [Bacteroidales bacterium]